MPRPLPRHPPFRRRLRRSIGSRRRRLLWRGAERLSSRNGEALTGKSPCSWFRLSQKLRRRQHQNAEAFSGNRKIRRVVSYQCASICNDCRDPRAESYGNVHQEIGDGLPTSSGDVFQRFSSPPQAPVDVSKDEPFPRHGRQVEDDSIRITPRALAIYGEVSNDRNGGNNEK